MSAFTCPVCKQPCPDLRAVLSCHPRETRAMTGRAASQRDIVAVLSGEVAPRLRLTVADTEEAA